MGVFVSYETLNHITQNCEFLSDPRNISKQIIMIIIIIIIIQHLYSALKVL